MASRESSLPDVAASGASAMDSATPDDSAASSSSAAAAGPPSTSSMMASAASDSAAAGPSHPRRSRRRVVAPPRYVAAEASDSSDAEPPPPPRRRAAAAASSASGSSGPPQQKRRRRTKKPVPEEEVDSDVEMDGWNRLPAVALLKVLRCLGNADVVSAGQTCRAWRTVTKLPCVWRFRTLCYDPDPEEQSDLDLLMGQTTRHMDWHSNAGYFARVILFAPVLAVVRCARSLKPFARKAVSVTSDCKVRGCELNGQNQWSLQYMKRQSATLEAVLLLNPKAEAMTTALKLPRLTSLEVAWEDDPNRGSYPHRPPPVVVPPVPAGTKGKLVKLTCRHGVKQDAVESLVRANAATLEVVSVSCLPPPKNVLRDCAKLKRLALRLEPGKKSQEDALRSELQGKRLDSIVFLDMSEHSAATCKALRDSLQPLARDPVQCKWCSTPASMRRAPAPLPRARRAYEVYDYFFDGFADYGYDFGGCNCLSCCNQWDDYDDVDADYEDLEYY